MTNQKKDPGIEPAENPSGQQGRHGLVSDETPGLVPPSQLNEGDTSAASDEPEARDQLDFDDGEMYGERGKNVRMGGTYAAQGADSAPLGPPAEILSSSNLPSDQKERPESAASDDEKLEK